MRTSFILIYVIFFNVLQAQGSIKFDTTNISLGDMSGVFYSSDAYYSISPKKLNDIIEIVEVAKKHNKKVIVRGSSHSLNGSSIPSPESILCITENLDSFKIVNDSTLYIEAGVNLYDCNKSLSISGYRVKVLNSGGKAPSLGGFISAGGIGENGNTGFWETVNSIQLIDGKANSLNLSKNDTLFKWLFGSMGQFGVIHSAYLSIEKISNNEVNIENFDMKSFAKEKKFYWFPMFFEDKIPIESINNEINKISKECISSEHSLVQNSKFSKVVFENFNPPLIFDQQKDFYFLGFQLFLDKATYSEDIKCVRDEIDSFVFKNKIKTYFQVSYYNQSSKNIEKYIGKPMFNKLIEIDAFFDPYNLFGINLVNE